VAINIEMKRNYFEESVDLHRKLKGKLSIVSKTEITSMEDLAVVYSPGVAQPCIEISRDISLAKELTIKANTVAIVTDGSAVLGLGNIGAEAAIPVMEGKAILFKEFAGIDAFPICIRTQDTAEIIQTIKNISPVFGGINLEDIQAPKCFEIEDSLQSLGIPVFHDDQHGTAIVLLAALMNACKVTNKKLSDLKIVINGSGAAGVAILKLLKCIDYDANYCTPVRDVIMCDTLGIISRDRKDLNTSKKELLKFSNKNNLNGTVKDALVGADVFIGVSSGNLLTAEDIQTMYKDPIVFAMANPTPEIMPDEAYKGGAAVVGTGRSDLPNQVNNVLAFPGIFKGALRAKANRITNEMKLAAAIALSEMVAEPSREHLLPNALDKSVPERIADAVEEAWEKQF
jgi:malate dehydrogenase (oxaloacetate-decarboxylating)